MYSDMSISVGALYAPSAVPAVSGLTNAQIQTAFDALFAQEAPSSGVISANSYVRIKNVREFPAMGTPPNIVNVPVFGQSTSQQIQGQADAPSMEISLNFVAADWAAGTPLGNFVGSGKSLVVRFALLNSLPAGYASTSTATGLGGTVNGAAVENTYWYFTGKIDSLLVTPSLSDSNQAKIAITLQSKLYGAFTTA